MFCLLTQLPNGRPLFDPFLDCAFCLSCLAFLLRQDSFSSQSTFRGSGQSSSWTNSLHLLLLNALSPLFGVLPLVAQHGTKHNCYDSWNRTLNYMTRAKEQQRANVK